MKLRTPAAIDRYFFSPAKPEALALARIILTGGFLYHFFNARMFFGVAQNCGSTWIPISYFKIFLRPCFSAETTLLIAHIWQGCLVATLLGLGTRVIMPITALLSLLIVPFGFNIGKIDHVSHLPMAVFLILSFSRCGDRFSIDWLIRRQFERPHWVPVFAPRLVDPAEYCWPLMLARLYFCLIYLEAALQKLRNSGWYWFDPLNTQVLLLTRPTLTAFGDLIANSQFLAGASAVAILLLQFAAGLTLFFPRLAVISVPGVALFHIMSYQLMGNHGYFFPYLWAYGIWLPMNIDSSQILARLLAWLSCRFPSVTRPKYADRR